MEIRGLTRISKKRLINFWEDFAKVSTIKVNKKNKRKKIIRTKISTNQILGSNPSQPIRLDSQPNLDLIWIHLLPTSSDRSD